MPIVGQVLALSAALSIIEAHELGRIADAGFDGGEFSGAVPDPLPVLLAHRVSCQLDHLVPALPGDPSPHEHDEAYVQHCLSIVEEELDERFPGWRKEA